MRCAGHRLPCLVRKCWQVRRQRARTALTDASTHEALPGPHSQVCKEWCAVGEYSSLPVIHDFASPWPLSGSACCLRLHLDGQEYQARHCTC